MNKPGYRLPKHRPSHRVASSHRPFLTLGARTRKHIITCIVCDAEKLVHRSGVKTCGVKCRVAWHRLSPEEQLELMENRRRIDELQSAR